MKSTMVRWAVLGRDLHEFLEIKTPYKQWFDRMSEYGFEENQDYGAIAQKCVTAQETHLLKLNM